MKKILGLTVAALLVMALVGGGTWAYFSDIESVATSTLSGGTLDLGLDETQGGNSTDGVTALFDASTMAPGVTVISDTIYVYNSGSIDMSSLTITFTPSVVTDGTPIGVTAGPGGDTDDLLKMITTTDVKFGTVGSPTDVVALEGKTLTELAALSPYTLGTLNTLTEKELFLEFTFSSAATNGCQGDSLTMDIDITGSQS